MSARDLRERQRPRCERRQPGARSASRPTTCSATACRRYWPRCRQR